MRAATDGAGRRWNTALVGVALLALAVSIALFSGARRTGNASGSPRSVPTGSHSPRSPSGNPARPASPDSALLVPASTNDPFLTADWTATPTDISGEIPTGPHGLSGDDFDSALGKCANDQDSPGSSGGENPPVFPIAETRAGFTAFVVTYGPSSAQICIAHHGGDLSHGSYRFDPGNAGFDAGTALSLPRPGLSRLLDLIVIELGQVQPDVAKMTFTLTDGSVVTASVGGGWAFAWWPGSATAETVTEYAADGSVVNQLRPDPPTDWPPPSPVAPAPIDTSLFVVPPSLTS